MFFCASILVPTSLPASRTEPGSPTPPAKKGAFYAAPTLPAQISGTRSAYSMRRVLGGHQKCQAHLFQSGQAQPPRTSRVCGRTPRVCKPATKGKPASGLASAGTTAAKSLSSGPPLRPSSPRPNQKPGPPGEIPRSWADSDGPLPPVARRCRRAAGATCLAYLVHRPHSSLHYYHFRLQWKHAESCSPYLARPDNKSRP
jgi:hypothetical protein